jgi:hypothetical protein
MVFTLQHNIFIGMAYFRNGIYNPITGSVFQVVSLFDFYTYYWGHGKLGRCVIQLSKFLNHTLATHKQA